MSFSIGIISDPHSTTAHLADALRIFSNKKTDMIICAGDIAGYGQDELNQTIELLQKHDCLMISGNHDDISDEKLRLSYDSASLSFLDALPKQLTLEIEKNKIYVVHASPPDKQHGGIKLLDQEGNIIKKRLKEWQTKLNDFEYDILIIGHTHQVFSEYINNTLVINPGSTTYNNSCMILSLPDKTVTTYPLLNNKIIKSWNWGLFYKSQSDSTRVIPTPTKAV